MHHQRHKIIPNEPKHRRDILISNEYLLIIKNEELIFADTEGDQRIIIFGTKKFFC